MHARAVATLFALSAGTWLTGCDAVVGANCAPGLDPCGALCCVEGYACSEALTCEPRPGDGSDAGWLGPWPRPDSGEADGGTPWRPDAQVPEDGGPDAGPDAEVDGGPTDAEPDAGPDGGPSDAEPDAGPDGGPSDAEPDAGPVDANPDAGTDAGFPDASPDAGFPDASPDAGFPDASPDAGFPDASPDAGFPDASLDGGVDAGDGGVDAGDGGVLDGGPICPLGTQLCDGLCFNTQTSTTHCGACNNGCAAFEACNAGVCAPTCTAPRTQCPGGCVHVQNDPSNCGTCGTTCGSNVCYQGGCVAPSAGHIVVIGHDMRSTHPATVNIAGNSIFLPVQSHLEIGVFRETTSLQAELALTWVLGTAAAQIGRTYNAQNFPAAEVTQRLANVDVFVIYPQEGATDLQLLTWGSDWSLALRGFVRRGGTVVLFDAGGVHAGAWQILQAAGLFPATARTPLLAGTVLDVIAPADAIVRGAPLSYPAMNNTTTFTSTSGDVVVETRSLPAQPVIFHRVVLP